MIALREMLGLAPLPCAPRALHRLIEEAQSGHVLGQLAERHTGITDNIPLDNILETARRRARCDWRALEFECDRLERALVGTEIRPIVVKGAAYILTHHPAARGRLASDLDILVPEEQLEALEDALRNAGWDVDETVDNTADIAYYREQMHELPALRHSERRSLMDVHFRLLPRRARYRIDHHAMIAAARPVPGRQLAVLSPVDQFLHMATHAFLDGEWQTPLRTVFETYDLYEALTDNEKDAVYARAQALGVPRAAELAFWLLRDILGRKILEDIPPPPMRLRLLFGARLSGGVQAKFAVWLLWVRGHYLRAPLWRAGLHLLRKLGRRH